MKYQTTILESFPVLGLSSAEALGTAIPMMISGSLILLMSRFMTGLEIKQMSYGVSENLGIGKDQAEHLLKLLFKEKAMNYTANDLEKLNDIKSRLIQNKSLELFIEFIDNDIAALESRNGALFKTINKLVSPVLGISNRRAILDNLNFIREFLLK